MAKFPTFEAGNLSLRPSETGVEAEAGAARRVGAFFNQQAGAQEMLARETDRLGGMTQQVGRETGELGTKEGAALASEGRAIGSGIAAAGDAAVKYLDNQQISHGSAAYATLLQNTTQQWNDTVKNADPNDPAIADKFLEKLDGQLADFKNNGFYTENGQKWAEAHTEALRQHFAEKTMADMSSLAGEAARVNQQQTVNSLSATVHGDPSSIDFALASLKSTTEGMIAHSPNLRGVDAANARSEILQKGSEAIVKSAAIGYIERAAKMPDWVTDPKYAPYVNGPELQMFEKAAKAQAKTNELQDKQLQVTQRQLADLQVHTGATKVMTDNVSFDQATGQPIIDPKYFSDALELARKNPNAPSAAETVRTMLSWGESQQNKANKIIDDPNVKKDLTDRMFDPDRPTSRIDLMKAQADGKLSNHSFQAMSGLVKEMETTPLKGDIWKSTTQAVKDRLIRTDLPEGRDAAGAANYSSFMQSFLPEYIAKSRAGTLEPNALNLNDPKSMINQALQPYRGSMQDRLRTQSSAPASSSWWPFGGSSAPEPAKPESTAAAPLPPEPLRGIASLQYSKSRNMWRDETTNKLYKADGTEATK